MNKVLVDEATVKLVLKALEHLQPTALTSFYTIGDGDRDNAITDLRKALAEQPADQHMKTVIEMAIDSGFWREHINTWMCRTKDIEDFAELIRTDERARMAEQPAKQEPVAWMHEWEDGEKIPLLKGRDSRNQDKPKTVRPLVYGDTSPQPAQSEPLTHHITANTYHPAHQGVI